MRTYRYNYNNGNQLKNYDDLEKLDIYDKYIYEAKPITKRQFDICREKSGKYIFRNKDNYSYCTACDRHFELIGGKHKELIKCPKCGKEVQIHNVWRTKLLPTWHDWYAFIEKIKERENTVLIRYILTKHNGDGSINCEECARVIWNIAIDEEIHYEWDYDPDYGRCNWRIQNTQYFNYYRGMTPNSYICTGAEWNKGYLDLFQSLPCLSRVDLKELDYENFARIARCASIVEKLQKMNLSKLAVKWLENYWWSKDKYFDLSKSSGFGMLKINRNDFHYLLENQSLDMLSFLQNHPNTNDKEVDNFIHFGEYGLDKITEKCEFYHIKRGKTINYIKNKVNTVGFKYTDYIDYLDMIDRLQYPIDNQYAYPKDFKKFKQLVIDRYNEMREKERKMSIKDFAIAEAKKDEKIYLLSKALRESPELKQWFDGKDGLKVFVPESVGELLDAGLHLHNCLGNYANKILSKESIVFFIRRIDQPDKDYIAMEYLFTPSRNGIINQIRMDNHKRVYDKKIINFADALVKKLNEMNVKENIVEDIMKEVA